VYTNSHDGQGGLPYGTSGKGLLLLSGGIDSPVAGYKIAKRGMQLTALHFWSYPYTSEAAKQKVQKLVKLLSRYCPNMQLYIVNSTKLQEHIKKYCDDEYLITILRRCMLRIAKDIANRLKLDCIVTGESLGQVASQTIDSINISNHAINDLPILRPLISLDKSEIITIARQIDTYDTSILPYEDCCTVFMPRRPAIHPTRERALANESKIPDFDALIQQTIQETIDLVKLNAN
jgi:thiamine biosynthesis protein ThiI